MASIPRLADVLKPGMSMRQMAVAKAEMQGKKVVAVSSHSQERRMRKEHSGDVEFFGPVSLGSKIKLFLV